MTTTAPPLSSFTLELRPQAGPVIGRPAELSAIEQVLDTVAEGGLRAVTIEGEPGIGKTRLLEATATLAADRGFGVLTAISDEELRGPLIVARSLFSSEAARRIAAEAGQEEVLRRLGEGLAGQADPDTATLPPDQQLMHLFDLAALAVRGLAARSPVAILVDDAQWADEDSIRMLRYVVRAEATNRLVLVVSLRPEEAAASEVATLVADLERIKVARRLRLGRFTAVETGELLRQLLDGDVAPSTVAAIDDQAEGVPFMVEELARSYREAGLLQMIQGNWQLARKAERFVPPSVEMVIRRRANRLPEETRVALAEAAVVGRTFSLGDVVAVRQQLGDHGADQHDVAGAVEPAARAGLITELPEGWAADYRFVHEQVRAYAAGTLSRTRRRAIHAAIVELLMADGDPPPTALAMLARHALAAGLADRCARFSVEAARLSLEAHAPEEVLRIVDEALSAATNPQDRVALLRERDEALAMLRRPAERLETLPELASLAEALGDGELEIDVMLRRVAALRTSEEDEPAAELARKALELARARNDREGELRAALELGQALLGSPLGESFAPPLSMTDVSGAEEAYRRAAELAESLGDTRSLAAATRELGVVNLSRARERFKEWAALPDRPADYREYHPLVEPFMASQQNLQRALSLYEEIGDRTGMMGCIIAMAYSFKGADVRMGSARRVEEVRRLTRHLPSLTRESDRELQDAQMLFGVQLYARAFGFPDLALERGAEAYEAARRVGDRGLEFVTAGGMALTHLSLGEVARAEEWIDRAARAAAAAPTPLRARQLETWKGMAASAAGDARGMKEHLQLALELATEHGKPASRCEALARLAIESALLGWSAEDADLLGEAERWADEAARLSPSLPGEHPWTAQAEAARALVRARTGRADSARESAMAALAGLEDMGIRESESPFPLHLDVIVGAARVLGSSEEEPAERARDLIRALLRLVGERTMDEDVRVRWFRGPAQRELVELVGPVEIPEPVPGPAGATSALTQPETDVLRLVTLGMTNPEIAAELGLSEDEVRRQLDSVYAKLGVSSRAGATMFAFMEGVA